MGTRLEEVAATSKDEYTWSDMFRREDLRKAVFIALGVQFFQQATGSEAVVYYAPEILQRVGITSDSSDSVSECL